MFARNQKFIIKEVRQEQGQFYFKADLVAEKEYNKNVKYLHKRLDFIDEYTNEKSFMPKGSEFKNTKVIARDKEIRVLKRLKKTILLKKVEKRKLVR